MLTLEQAAKFHGHLGPFLTIGYIAGRMAVKVLKPKDLRDLRARVSLPLKTPFSCVIDGIQCSSGCTLGKLNIETENSSKIRIKFEKRGSNSLELRVREEVVENCLKLGMEEAVKWLLSLKEDQIFEIKM